MTMPDVSTLPVDLDAVYADSTVDPTQKLHQQHHDLSHGAVKALVARDTEVSTALAAKLDTTTASATYAAKAEVAAGDVYPLASVTLTAPATARPVDTLDGVLYGRGEAAPHAIYSSSDSGTTWTLVNTLPTQDPEGANGGGIVSLFKAADGEMIVNRGAGLWRSTGWAANPATATWTRVLKPTGAAIFASFGVDVQGDRVVAAEYSAAVPWTDSKYVYLSTDNGQTFSPIFDKNAAASAISGGDPLSAHLHAACIDTTANNRIFIAWHQVNTGAYARTMYTDAPNGLSTPWTTVIDSDKFTMTTLTASAAGIVGGSDGGGVTGSAGNYDGLYRILRRSDPAQMVMESMHYVRSAPLGFGLVAQAARRLADGTVVVTFESNANGVHIMASTDGRRGSTVYVSPTNWTKVGNPVVDPLGRFLTVLNVGAFTTPQVLRAAWPPKGAPRLIDLNTGNHLGGVAQHNSSLAAGPGSTTATTQNSVAIGRGVDLSASVQGATAVGSAAQAAQEATAVGWGAKATAIFSAVYGRSAEAYGQAAVVVGYNAKAGTSTASVANSTVVGSGTSALSHNQTLIGQGIVADNNSNNTVVGAAGKANLGSTAIGQAAEATGLTSVAVGRLAKATHGRSIAIGHGTVSTADDQFTPGARHIALLDVVAPGTPAAGAGRMYLEAGALKFKGTSGTVTTIAAA